MDKTMRIGFVAVAAAMLVACGGASESNEQIAGGTSRLDGKDPNAGTKDPNETSCEKPGDPGTKDPNAGACFGVVEGDKTSCKSASDWKTYANDVCTAKGAALVALGLGDECGTAKDSYTYVKFECCFSTANDPGDPGTKEPPKDPGTGGDPTSCTGEYLNNACQSEADWKDTASQVCAKSGLALTDIGYGAACGNNGEIGEVKFTCCK